MAGVSSRQLRHLRRRATPGMTPLPGGCPVSVVVYLARRPEGEIGRTERSQGDRIRRSEWLAAIDGDASLEPRPEMESGCVEWSGPGSPSDAGPTSRDPADTLAAEQRRLFIARRRGILIASSPHPGLIAKLVEIARRIEAAGSRTNSAIYLGVSVGEGGEAGGRPPVTLGTLLRAASGDPASRPHGPRPPLSVRGGIPLIGPAAPRRPSPRHTR